MKKIINRYLFENKYWKKFDYVLGLDEAGRGCWAGPLVVAGCILPKNYHNDAIRDSKKLSIKKREELFEIIKKDALSYHIVFIAPAEVDKLNPKQASIFGMERIIKEISPSPQAILIDAEKINTKIPNESIIKGDDRSISIAAASILAKVTRDKYMESMENTYPGYGFANHKGYGTTLHLKQLRKNGPIKGFYRFSYRPIKNVLLTIKDKKIVNS